MRLCLLLLFSLSLLATGCRLFETKRFVERPDRVNHSTSFLEGKSSFSFQVTETIRFEGKDSLLAEKRVNFLLQTGPNSEQQLLMEVIDDQNGSEKEYTFPVDIVQGQGLILSSPNRLGSPNFFPVQIRGLDGGRTYNSLPAILDFGTQWEQILGPVAIRRQVTAIDTLEFRNRIEEAWVVSEHSTSEGTELASGTYWYGRSGLLQSEVSWPIDWRDPIGQSNGSALYRRFVRQQ